MASAMNPLKALYLLDLSAEPSSSQRFGKGTLIVAKLECLVRNVDFLSALIRTGIASIAAVNPYTKKLLIHKLAALASGERGSIIPTPNLIFGSWENAFGGEGCAPALYTIASCIS
jgi:hypothetical protein